MKHKNKIYLKTQENEYIKDFCLDIQNISINDINNIENKPLIINKHLFGNSKIIVYLKIQVNKGKYLNFLKYGIGNTYFCELNSIKNNYCNGKDCIVISEKVVVNCGYCIQIEPTEEWFLSA